MSLFVHKVWHTHLAAQVLHPICAKEPRGGGGGAGAAAVARWKCALTSCISFPPRVPSYTPQVLHPKNELRTHEGGADTLAQPWVHSDAFKVYDPPLSHTLFPIPLAVAAPFAREGAPGHAGADSVARRAYDASRLRNTLYTHPIYTIARYTLSLSCILRFHFRCCIQSARRSCGTRLRSCSRAQGWRLRSRSSRRGWTLQGWPMRTSQVCGICIGVCNISGVDSKRQEMLAFPPAVRPHSHALKHGANCEDRHHISSKAVLFGHACKAVCWPCCCRPGTWLAATQREGQHHVLAVLELQIAACRCPGHEP